MKVREDINFKNEEYKFSYEELKRFLIHAKKFAPIVPMKESATRKGKYIILRHDADLDIYPSYDVSKIEKEIGVNATFFVLTTSHTYNIQSSKIRKLLNEMSRDGFEIGLHFNPLVYGNITLAELHEKVKFECQILENIIDEPVISISLHSPSSSGKYPSFKGYINAYSKKLFSDEQYLSDSIRIDASLHPFRGKDPYEFVSHAKKYPLQITLHPEQFLEKGGDYVDTIGRYISMMGNDILRDYLNELSLIRDGKLWNIK